VHLETLEALNAERRARRAAVIVTDLSTGSEELVHEGDHIADDIGPAVLSAFRTGKSGVVTIDDRELFLNAHLPPPRILIIGAVHISQALAPMARIASFDVEVVDPRTAFATADRFPETTIHAVWPEEFLSRDPLDEFTAVAAVTHDPKIDDYPLRAALKAGCFYVGALGSRKTHAKRVERLIEGGATQDDIDRIRAPIGIDISAASPGEIAVAVLADIIRALRTRGLAPKTEG
jgi:xanthine dehydrogenase accessory factor